MKFRMAYVSLQGLGRSSLLNGCIRTPPPGAPIQEPKARDVPARSGLGRVYVSVAQSDRIAGNALGGR